MLEVFNFKCREKKNKNIDFNGGKFCLANFLDNMSLSIEVNLLAMFQKVSQATTSQIKSESNCFN